MENFEKYGVFQIEGDLLFNVYRKNLKIGDKFYANVNNHRVFCTVEDLDNFYTLFKKYNAINSTSAKRNIREEGKKWVKEHLNGALLNIGGNRVLCFNHVPYISHPDNPYPDFDKEKFLLED